jgi:hypothetical protein
VKAHDLENWRRRFGAAREGRRAERKFVGSILILSSELWQIIED